MLERMTEAVIKFTGQMVMILLINLLTSSGTDVLTFTTVDGRNYVWYGFAAGLDMTN